MNVEPIELEPGDSVSSPIVKAWGLFDHGIIREPRGRTSQFGIISNGKIKLNSGDQVRTSGILGSADLPIAVIYEDERIQKRIEQLWVLMFGPQDKASETLISIEADQGSSEPLGWRPFEMEICRNLKNMRSVIPILYGNTADPNSETFQDVITRTGNLPPEIGLIIQREENGWLTITGDRQFLTLALNVLQMNMAEIDRLNLGQPRLRPIGLGLFCADGDGFRMKKWPGTRLRVADTEEYAYFSLRENPYQFAAQRSQAVVTAIFSCFLRYWFPIAGLTFNDYVAIANVILLEYAGSGDIKVQPKFEAGDIVTEVFKYVGIGEALAYRLNPDSNESLVERWFFQVFLGWLANRYKGTVLPATLYPTGKAYAYKIAADFALFLQPQLPSVGSGASPYFLTASNKFETDTPIPVLVHEGETSYLHLLPIPTNIKFQTADVMMGEVPKAAVDQKATDEVWFRWRVKADSKMVTLDRFMRTLLQWRWPAWHIIKNKIPDIKRRLTYGMNLLASESTTLADGALIQAGLGIIPWSPVTVILNARYELELVKAETSTTGPQEIRPGAVTEKPREIPPIKKAEELAKAQENPLPTTAPGAPGTTGQPTTQPPSSDGK